LKALEIILSIVKWVLIAIAVLWLYTKISGLFGGQTLTQKFLPNTNKSNIIDALEAKGYSYVDAAKIADSYGNKTSLAEILSSVPFVGGIFEDIFKTKLNNDILNTPAYQPPETNQGLPGLTSPYVPSTITWPYN
jgi:hypothetical protein